MSWTSSSGFQSSSSSSSNRNTLRGRASVRMRWIFLATGVWIVVWSVWTTWRFQLPASALLSLSTTTTTTTTTLPNTTTTTTLESTISTFDSILPTTHTSTTPTRTGGGTGTTSSHAKTITTTTATSTQGVVTAGSKQQQPVGLRQYTLQYKKANGKVKTPIAPMVRVSLLDLTDLWTDPAFALQEFADERQNHKGQQQTTFVSLLENDDDDNNKNHNPEQRQQQQQPQDDFTVKHWRENKERLLQTLQAAGIQQVDVNILRLLPTWEQITALYGSESPHVIDTQSIHHHQHHHNNNNDDDASSFSSSSCRDYRRRVPLERRWLGVAGMYNTGTTALKLYLQANLPIVPGSNVDWKNKLAPPPQDNNHNNNKNKATTAANSHAYEVPWGKHRLLSSVNMTTTTTTNATTRTTASWPPPPLSSSSATAAVGVGRAHDILPIVIVRDPFTWMQSMCAATYQAKWFHTTRHCPNLIATQEDVNEYNKHKNHKNSRVYQGQPIPVSIPAQGETAQFPSLLHLWMEWYGQYWNWDRPRLFVRLEDLLWNPAAVVDRIRDCVLGAEQDHDNNNDSHDHPGHGNAEKSSLQQQQQQQQQPTHNNNNNNNKTPFVYLVGRSKWFHEHMKPQSSMISGMIKYGTGKTRLYNMTRDDLHYAVTMLSSQKQPSLMQLFHYSMPQV